MNFKARRKILIISIGGDGTSGAEAWCSWFSGVLKAQNYTVEILPLVINNNCKNAGSSGTVALTGDWGGWDKNTFVNILKARDKIKCFETTINKIDPDVIVCTAWAALFFLLILKSKNKIRAKTITVFHRQIQEVLFRSSFFNILVPVKLFFLKNYLRYSDASIVLNDSSRRSLLDWCKIDPVVIPNAIDVDMIVDKSSSGCTHIDKSKYLIYVGRLEKEKGLETLLKAFSYLPINEYKLLMVGQGSLTTRLEFLANKLNIANRVFFLGHIANPYPLMKNASAIVLASPWECQPFVVLEAYALKTPVIAVESPGVRELLDNGARGFLSKDSPVCLKVAILAALENEINQPKVFQGFAYVKSRSKIDMANDYLRVLNGVLQ